MSIVKFSKMVGTFLFLLSNANLAQSQRDSRCGKLGGTDLNGNDASNCAAYFLSSSFCQLGLQGVTANDEIFFSAVSGLSDQAKRCGSISLPKNLSDKLKKDPCSSASFFKNELLSKNAQSSCEEFVASRSRPTSRVRYRVRDL